MLSCVRHGRFRFHHPPVRPGACNPALYPVYLRETVVSHLGDGYRSLWRGRSHAIVPNSAADEVRVPEDQGMSSG